MWGHPKDAWQLETHVVPQKQKALSREVHGKMDACFSLPNIYALESLFEL